MLSSWAKTQDLDAKIPNVSKSRAAPRERTIWEPRVTQEGSPKISEDMAGSLLGSVNSPRHGEVSKINSVSTEGCQSGATGDGAGHATQGLRLIQENQSASQDSKGEGQPTAQFWGLSSNKP